jgi:hypothetical protein
MTTILLLYVGFWVILGIISLFIIAFLIKKRLKERKEETFEKRDS